MFVLLITVVTGIDEDVEFSRALGETVLVAGRFFFFKLRFFALASASLV